MKIFAIKDKYRTNTDFGYLFYYPNKKKFFIELLEDANEDNTPFMLYSFVQKGIKTINSKYSKLWVQQRIVPIDRQNIAYILKENGLKEYDEYELLMLTKGVCAQDEYYLVNIEFDDLENNIKNRFLYRIDDFVYLNDDKFLICFNNHKVKICNIFSILNTNDNLYKFLKLHPNEIKNGQIEIGGYSIEYSDDLFVTSEVLYEKGKDCLISSDDIYTYISSRLVNTKQACEILNCSRQNIEYLIDHNKLKPIIINDKAKMFLKKDIEKL